MYGTSPSRVHLSKVRDETFKSRAASLYVRISSAPTAGVASLAGC
jgi:hypothetical protein